MDKKTLVYFSGFQLPNKKTNNKYELLKSHFSDMNVILMSQSYDEKHDIEMVKKLGDAYDINNTYFIASSLGSVSGIYAYLFYNRPIVLINPSYFPNETLKDYLSDGKLFEIEKIKSLSNNLLQTNKIDEFIAVFVATNDERISDEQRVRFRTIFRNNIGYYDISHDGGHSYSILSEKLDTIKEFLDI